MSAGPGAPGRALSETADLGSRQLRLGQVPPHELAWREQALYWLQQLRQEWNARPGSGGDNGVRSAINSQRLKTDDP